MKVRDVLSGKAIDAVFTISPDATVRELVEALAEHNVGALLVSEDGEALLGIVSERDVVRKLREIDTLSETTVSTIMSTDLHVAASDDSMDSLMSTMTEHRIRHIPVVDDDRLVGVLSIGDAVKHRMDQLSFERDQLNSYVSGG